MAGRLERHMQATDAFTWYMERDPLLRSTVVAVLVFDRALDRAAALERIERASRVVPGMRHRLVEPPLRLAPPRWAVDGEFDLSYHVRFLRAPGPGTLDAVLDLARNAGMAAFDPARPLWEVTAVDGLADGRAAVVLKMHHSLSDGVGGMQLVASLFDVTREPADLGPMPDVPEPERVNLLGTVADATAYRWERFLGEARSAGQQAFHDAGHVLRDPLGAVRRGARTLGSVARTVEPVLRTDSPLMRARRLGWHYEAMEVSTDAMRRAAKAVDGTLNDAFLAGVAGGLHRYHLHHGVIVEELRVTLPINIRREGDPMGGNRITLMRFPVPIDIADPSERMRAVHARTAAVRDEPSIVHTEGIARAMNALPPGVVGGMLKHVDFVASNVPGIMAPLYLAGSKLERFYPFGPTIGTAVNCTLLSYCDECAIGVNSDTGAVPDPDVLGDCLDESFREVLAVGEGPVEVVRRARSG
jgi:WS/DGAT/MGAT family acyltransferase